jgi:lipid-binding SYLF domain-containing protein
MIMKFHCIFQIGGELTDFIIVLHDLKAVKAFSSRIHLSLGAGLSAAAGPIGRALEADVRASEKGSGICYTYSCSKGTNKKVASSHWCHFTYILNIRND